MRWEPIAFHFANCIPVCKLHSSCADWPILFLLSSCAEKPIVFLLPSCAAQPIRFQFDLAIVFVSYSCCLADRGTNQISDWTHKSTWLRFYVSHFVVLESPPLGFAQFVDKDRLEEHAQCAVPGPFSVGVNSNCRVQLPSARHLTATESTPLVCLIALLAQSKGRWFGSSMSFLSYTFGYNCEHENTQP